LKLLEAARRVLRFRLLFIYSNTIVPAGFCFETKKIAAFASPKSSVGAAEGCDLFVSTPI
jgi:hypothetical protein